MEHLTPSTPDAGKGIPGPHGLEHIVCTPGVCGGRPRIADTRIRVQDIFLWHELRGETPDEIVSKFPHLSLADVYAALAYYWDHAEKIQRHLREDEGRIEQMSRETSSLVEKKLAAKVSADAAVDPLSPR